MAKEKILKMMKEGKEVNPEDVINTVIASNKMNRGGYTDDDMNVVSKYIKKHWKLSDAYGKGERYVYVCDKHAYLATKTVFGWIGCEI